MDNETAIAIFRAVYDLLKTMHQDPPPHVELNFEAGYIMGRISNLLNRLDDAK